MEELKDHRLERGSDRVLGGVCSGLAHHLSIDPLLVRLAFVLLALASGAGIVLYLLLWLFVPDAGEPPRQGDLLAAGIRSVGADLRRILGDPATPGRPPPPPSRPVHHHGGLALGILLIVLGAVLMATSAGLLAWWDWAVMWPVLVIGLGLLLLVRRLS